MESISELLLYACAGIAAGSTFATYLIQRKRRRIDKVSCEIGLRVEKSEYQLQLIKLRNDPEDTALIEVIEKSMSKCMEDLEWIERQKY